VKRHIIPEGGIMFVQFNIQQCIKIYTFGRAGRNIVIDGAGAGKKDLNEIYRGKAEMLLEASRRIQEAIAGIAEEIADNVEISGLMIFGGDTALSICRRLEAKALRILGEVEPLVPYGKFTGGKLDGVHIATKAGGFGKEDIILKTAEYFRGCL